MKIKICGITRVEDALLAGQLGAWAIGLIFVSTSPRMLTLEKALKIIDALERSYPKVLKIGVFADQPEDFISSVSELCKLNGIQFHGEEPPEFIDRFHCSLKIKAFIITDIGLESLLEKIRLYRDCLPLLDLPKGKSVSQDLLFTYASELKNHNIEFIIAGGIGPENINRFIPLSPYAIDIARGVEISPGIKDKEKLIEIFRIVKGDEINV